MQRGGGAVEADIGRKRPARGLGVEAGKVRALMDKPALGQNTQEVGSGSERVGHRKAPWPERRARFRRAAREMQPRRGRPRATGGRFCAKSALMPPRPGEDDLIARYFAPLAGPAGLGLRDDAALIRPPAGHELVVTTDALVAGVHFFADDPPGAIARKALRVSLSDLAAKGAAPLGFVLNLALPSDWTAEWLAAFAAGLGEDAAAYACPLIGGDTVKTPGPLSLAITAFGVVAPGRFAARSGARAGDAIYVTGTIGDAALGLRLRLGQGPSLAKAHRDFLLDRYLLPQPRMALAPAMARFAGAGMDISD